MKIEIMTIGNVNPEAIEELTEIVNEFTSDEQTPVPSPPHAGNDLTTHKEKETQQ